MNTTNGQSHVLPTENCFSSAAIFGKEGLDAKRQEGEVPSPHVIGDSRASVS